MSIKEPSSAAVRLSSMAPIRGRVLSPSNPLDDVPIFDRPPTKKTASKKKTKVPKKKVATQTKSAEQVVYPAQDQARYRYGPYRRSGLTSEPEASLPADPEDLETLDATVKYSSTLKPSSTVQPPFWSTSTKKALSCALATALRVEGNFLRQLAKCWRPLDAAGAVRRRYFQSEVGE